MLAEVGLDRNGLDVDRNGLDQKGIGLDLNLIVFLLMLVTQVFRLYLVRSVTIWWASFAMGSTFRTHRSVSLFPSRRLAMQLKWGLMGRAWRQEVPMRPVNSTSTPKTLVNLLFRIAFNCIFKFLGILSGFLFFIFCLRFFFKAEVEMIHHEWKYIRLWLNVIEICVVILFLILSWIFSIFSLFDSEEKFLFSRPTIFDWTPLLLN